MSQQLLGERLFSRDTSLPVYQPHRGWKPLPQDNNFFSDHLLKGENTTLFRQKNYQQ